MSVNQQIFSGRKRLLVVVTCLWFTGAPNTSAQESITALVRRMAPSVVTVTAYYRNPRRSKVASGFFIEEQQIVSNWHVVAGANRIQISTADGRIFTVRRVTGFNLSSDVVMLTIDKPEPTVRPLPVLRSLPERGERIFVIGNPLGTWKGSVTDGIVSAIRKVPDVGEIIQITAPISMGSSGSPVINMDGEVIGMASLMDVRGQNLNFAVSGEMIETLRDSVYDQLISDVVSNAVTYSVPMKNGRALEKPRVRKNLPRKKPK